MAIVDAWTDPSEGGSLDLDNGGVITSAKWQLLAGNLLNLGGAAGTRNKVRTCWWWPVDTTMVLVGSIPAVAIPYGASLHYISGRLSSDVGTVITWGPVFIAASDGTYDLDFQIRYGAAGEANNAQTSSYLNSTPAMVANKWTFIDLAGDIGAGETPLAAGDSIGMAIERTGGDTNATINLVGLRYSYLIGA